MALSMALGASLVNQRLHVVDIESESAKISGKTSELASMLEQAGWRPQRAVSLRRERSRISEEEFRQTTEDEQLLKGGFPRVYMVAGQDHIHENLARAVSNLEGVHVVPRKGLNCLDLLKSDVVLLSPGAIEYWQNVHASANKGGLASSAQ
jgi:ribosomal protein L4